MTWAMVAVAGVSLVSGIGSSIKQNRKAKDEEKLKNDLNDQIKEFEANRQPVINQAAEIRGLKNQLSNPAANLGVATQAADIQMEQTDQALANSLDVIRQSGGGGATALAQAAAQSKAQVSASIQTQEAANEKARMQGEANLQKQRMGIEQAALGEEAAAWGRQEDRDIAQLNRDQGQMEAAAGAQAQYETNANQAFMEGVGGATDTLSGVD